MGRLLTYPDQSQGPRFDEVLLLPDASVGWYAWLQGAGNWDSYAKPAGSLGGHFTDVSACFVLFQQKVYLYIVGTAPDGTRSLKVMDPLNFTVVQDWQQQQPGQSAELAFSKRATLA